MNSRNTFLNRSHLPLRVSLGSAGFTLLETILALALAGLLMASVYFAIDQAWKLTSSGREEMERAQIARALIHRIGIDIRAITYVPPPPAEDTLTDDTSSSSSSSSSGSGGSGGSASGGGGTSGGGGIGGGTGSSGGGSSKGSSTGGGGSSSGGSKSSSGGGGGSGGGGSGGSGGGSSSGGSNSSSSNSSSSSSSTTSTTETPVPNSKSIGVRGTNQQIEISITRSRRDLLQGSGAAAQSSPTSDLREVTYTFHPPGSSSMSGLVRTEGDRMAIEVAEAAGGAASQYSVAQMLAPEIASLHFRYFDGRVWSETWDSDTVGRIPRAIEINVTFPPLKRKRSVFGSAVDTSMNKFRTLITIPISDPFPKDFVQ